VDDEPVRSDDPALLDEIGFLAVKAGTTVTRLARARLRPLGLHVRSYSVLALAGTRTGRTQREVAEYLDLDPSQVVMLVDDLEERALVTRDVVPGDRRARQVRVTAAGAALLDDARRATAEAEDEALAHLTPTQRQTLLRLLRTASFADEAGARPGTSTTR
jgi:DNA-binding MarR family transcriptional regulator